MAKSTKPKKIKEQVEEKVEPVIEQPEEQIPIVEETPIPEIGEEPPSTTLDEVKEAEVPKEEEAEEPKGIVYTKNEDYEKVYNFSHGKLEEVQDVPMDEKIIKFLESREGEIRMNDFLKSLFDVPKFGEPPLWMNKGENKRLSLILQDIQGKGYCTFISNSHLKLGQFYHDGEDQRTKHHNLGTVNIIAKK